MLGDVVEEMTGMIYPGLRTRRLIEERQGGPGGHGPLSGPGQIVSEDVLREGRPVGKDMTVDGVSCVWTRMKGKRVTGTDYGR